MSKRTQIARFSEELSQTIPQLMRFSKALSGAQSDPLTQGEITLPQYLTLDLLKTNGAAKMKQIAASAKVTMPAATGLVARLVKMGLVKRSYDKDDRRVIFVALTPQGKKAITRVKDGRKKLIMEMFGELTEQERQMYIRIIRKIKTMLDAKQKR